MFIYTENHQSLSHKAVSSTPCIRHISNTKTLILTGVHKNIKPKSNSADDIIDWFISLNSIVSTG